MAENKKLILVTCLYDLNKYEKRPSDKSLEKYLKLGEKILDLKIPIIIFTEQNIKDEILKLNSYTHITFIILPFEDLPFYNKKNIIQENRKQHPIFNYNPTKDTSLYTLLMWHKSFFVNKGIDSLEPNNSSISSYQNYYAWIDFGIFHVEKYQQYKDAFDINNISEKIHIFLMKCFNCDILKRNEHFYDNFQGHICSGYITGDKNHWKDFDNLFNIELETVLSKNYAPNDEQLFTMILAKNPYFFDLTFGDYYSCLSNYKNLNNDVELMLWSLKQSIIEHDCFFGIKLAKKLLISSLDDPKRLQVKEDYQNIIINSIKNKLLSYNLKDVEIIEDQDKWELLSQDNFMITRQPTNIKLQSLINNKNLEPLISRKLLTNNETLDLPNDVSIHKKAYRTHDWSYENNINFSSDSNKIYNRYPGILFDHLWWIEFVIHNLDNCNYIEYGLGSGENINHLSHIVENCYGVDINFIIGLNKKIKFFKGMTDDFSRKFLPQIKFNVAFVDADHESIQAFRDATYLFHFLEIGGYLFLHDTYPCYEKYFQPNLCNDCYRVVYFIKNNWDIQSYQMLTLPFNPGLTIIHKIGDNQSSLDLNLLDILSNQNIPKIPFQNYMNNFDHLISQDFTFQQQRKIYYTTLPNQDNLVYYHLLSMLCNYGFNQPEAENSVNIVRKEFLTGKYSHFIQRKFDWINYIFGFYPFENWKGKELISQWTENDLILGNEIISDKIPSKNHQFNCLLINNFGIRILPDYKVYIISHQPLMVKEIQKILPEAIHFDGTNYPSFSKLVNDCIKQCPTEIVIILSDKVKPKSHHIKKMLMLLNDYALVALFRFACFALKKDLIRTIGFLDENYLGGGWEDDDFLFRLQYYNLPIYFSEEDVGYERGPSSWDKCHVRTSHIYHDQIWLMTKNFLIRRDEAPKMIENIKDENWYRKDWSYHDSMLVVEFDRIYDMKNNFDLMYYSHPLRMIKMKPIFMLKDIKMITNIQDIDENHKLFIIIKEEEKMKKVEEVLNNHPYIIYYKA